MRRAWLLMSVVCATVTACGGATPSISSSAAAPTSASSAATVALRQAPDGLGCDTIGIPYTSTTFHIDAAAVDPVTATTNQGVSLRTFWSAGFVGGSADDPVVRDPGGQVVAADGDVLEIPQGAFPRLKGYFVCPSPDALYILLRDPT
jgi:hypothetical protein